MIEYTGSGILYALVQAIICLCVIVLFLAVFIDFAMYSGAKKVQKEKKSIVETGTMTLFFFIFYLILRSEIGRLVLSSGSIKDLLMIVGTLMIISGCIINVKGRFNLGKNWANQIKIYQEQSLVQAGMYKIVRHPLYASIILMFYGACLVYRNFVALLSVSLIFIPFMYYRARQEELLLTQRFPQYEEYRQNTGMFFPKIRIRRQE